MLLVGPVVLFEHGCKKGEEIVYVDVLGGARFRVQKQRIDGTPGLLARLKAFRAAGSDEIDIRAGGQVEYHDVEVAIAGWLEAGYPRLSFGGVYHGRAQPRGSSGSVRVPRPMATALHIRIHDDGTFQAGNVQTEDVGELEEVLHSLLRDDPRQPIIVCPRSGVKWQVVREVFVLAKHASRGGVWLKPSP